MSTTFQRKTLLVAALALCAAGAVALWARGSTADEAAPAAATPAATAKPALTVTTVRPQLGRLPMQLSANGSIAAWQEASVGAEANGLRLAQVRAAVGDVVRAGQVLATFDAASVQADLALARAQLQEAQANALEAAGNAERARTLKDSGALSTQQINQYLTLEQTAQARVAAARAALDVQQLRGIGKGHARGLLAWPPGSPVGCMSDRIMRLWSDPVCAAIRDATPTENSRPGVELTEAPRMLLLRPQTRGTAILGS